MEKENINWIKLFNNVLFTFIFINKNILQFKNVRFKKNSFKNKPKKCLP